MTRPIAILALAPLLACAPAEGQTPLQRARSAPDGAVLLSYAARPGVCGYQDGFRLRAHGGEGETIVWRDDDMNGRWRDKDGRERCEEGPVHVRLTVRGGEVEEVDVRVASGFSGAAATDLGTLSPAEAAELLLGVARTASGDPAGGALLALALAEGVEPAPLLLELAGDAAVAEEAREKAVFWAAETGATTAQLARLYAGERSEEVREQIIFAYSRLEEPAATRELLRLARGDGEVELRNKAVFWLGQAAGREITRELGEMAEDDGVESDVREQAVFALSQRPDGEGIPALLRIARTSPHPEVRKKALFWLGQSGDPRALALFEEILK